MAGVKENTIDSAEWDSLLRGFSDQHHKWLVTVDSVGPSGNDRRLATDSPLQEISLSDPTVPAVSLIVGQESEKPRVQIIERVQRLILQGTGDGVHSGLVIESEDGGRTTLKFRSPKPSQMVNGIA
jgi:hypothetical protein